MKPLEVDFSILIQHLDKEFRRVSNLKAKRFLNNDLMPMSKRDEKQFRCRSFEMKFFFFRRTIVFRVNSSVAFVNSTRVEICSSLFSGVVTGKRTMRSTRESRRRERRSMFSWNSSKKLEFAVRFDKTVSEFKGAT